MSGKEPKRSGRSHSKGPPKSGRLASKDSKASTRDDVPLVRFDKGLRLDEEGLKEVQQLQRRLGFNWSKTCKIFGLKNVKLDSIPRMKTFDPTAVQGSLALTVDISDNMKEQTLEIIKQCQDRVNGLLIRNPKAKDSPKNIEFLLLKTSNIVAAEFFGATFKGALLDSLLKVIKTSATLESLDISHTRLKDEGCVKVCEVLAQSTETQLKDLNISSNSLTPDAAPAIADLLSSNAKLEIFRATNNQLKTNGVIPIFESLVTNTTLKVLILDSNLVYSTATPALHDVILDNEALKIVSLRNNSIDSAGADYIANSIRVKKIMLSTKHFKSNQKDFEPFTSTQFSDVAEEEIPDNLRETLWEFNRLCVLNIALDGNDIDESVVEDINFVLNTPFMSVFRFRDEKIFWSREAWCIAETEFGPKFIKDSIKALSRRSKGRMKAVIHVKNREGQTMLEVLMRNTFTNKAVYMAVRTLFEYGELNLDEKDSLGRTYTEVLRHHLNTYIRTWAMTLGAFDMRYMISPGPALHVSSSAEVLVATDVKTDKEVVLKIFKERADFDTEIHIREALKKNSKKKGQAKSILREKLQARRRQLKKTRENFAEKVSGRSDSVSRDPIERTVNRKGSKGGGKNAKAGKGKKPEKRDKGNEPTLPKLEMHDYIIQMLNHALPGTKYKYVVYEKADRSLFDIMNTERVAGVNFVKIKTLMRKAAECLQFLNGRGYMHGDFKPNSFLRVNYNSDEFKLIDFDSSVIHGDHVSDAFSSAYIPPEVAKAKLVYAKRVKENPDATAEEKKKSRVRASEKFDVWSYGVVLFEMFSATKLFETINPDDSLATVEAKAELINWLEIPAEKLQRVLEIPENSLANRDVYFARELVRWCLQQKPEQRPTFTDILAHPFFSEGASIEESNVSLPRNLRTHLFLSHIQSQAAGTVKDVFYAAKQFGCSSWLDMKAGRITQQAMYDGVALTEAFVVCLTKDTFFSTFCLKEFMWALDMQKKMIFLVEVDNRELMSPFRETEFFNGIHQPEKMDQLVKNIGDFKGLMLNNWIKQQVSESKSVIKEKYDSNEVKFVLQELVLEKIKSVLHSEDCIPYRRREYENVAMMQYVLKRIGFVPPSDPVFYEKFELTDNDQLLGTVANELANKGSSRKQKFYQQRLKDKEKRRNMLGDIKQKQFQARRDMVQRKRNVTKKPPQQRKKSVEEVAEEIFAPGLLKDCAVVVFIGKGVATGMSDAIRESLKNYLEFEDFDKQWQEFGPDDKLSKEKLRELTGLQNLAIISIITPGFFIETVHGDNLIVLEQGLKKKGKLEFPVVMVQDGFFGRPWSEIQAEVGERYNHYLLDVEFMPYRAKDLRLYEHEAMVGEVATRVRDLCDHYAAV